MPALSRKARRRIFERLAQLERTREAMIDASVARLNEGYTESLQELRDRVEGAVRLDDAGRLRPDADVVGALRLRALRDARLMGPLWESWSRRLDALAEVADDAIRLTGSRLVRLGDQDRALLAELRGLWPFTEGGRRREDATGGLAGRFYNLSTHHRQELANVVTRAVLGRERRTQLVAELRQWTGRSKSQAEQLFHDGTIQFERAVAYRKATASGVEWFEYVGPLDRVTRPFCWPLVDRVLSRREIDRLDNGQTGLGSVFIAGGGYRCRHHWRPVRRDWFDDDEWRELRGDRA